MLLFQEDYQNQLQKITQLKCSRETKIHMLKALIDQLKSKCNAEVCEEGKKNKTLATEDTLYSDAPPVDLPQQIAELEHKIIIKRDIKISLNEEIEDGEEELEAIGKTVFSKMQLDDELKRRIDLKMFEIETQAYNEKKK